MSEDQFQQDVIDDSNMSSADVARSVGRVGDMLHGKLEELMDIWGLMSSLGEKATEIIHTVSAKIGEMLAGMVGKIIKTFILLLSMIGTGSVAASGAQKAGGAVWKLVKKGAEVVKSGVKNAAKWLVSMLQKMYQKLVNGGIFVMIAGICVVPIVALMCKYTDIDNIQAKIEELSQRLAEMIETAGNYINMIPGIGTKLEFGTFVTKAAKFVRIDDGSITLLSTLCGTVDDSETLKQAEELRIKQEKERRLEENAHNDLFDITPTSEEPTSAPEDAHADELVAQRPTKGPSPGATTATGAAQLARSIVNSDNGDEELDREVDEEVDEEVDGKTR